MVSVVVDSLAVCVSHSCGAGSADGRASAVVFVVGGDIPDGLVQPDGVVFALDPAEFGVEDGGVLDVFEVGPLPFEMPEEALDVCLVGGGSGSSVMLDDGHQRHEGLGVAGGHLGAVV